GPSSPSMTSTRRWAWIARPRASTAGSLATPAISLAGDPLVPRLVLPAMAGLRAGRGHEQVLPGAGPALPPRLRRHPPPPRDGGTAAAAERGGCPGAGRSTSAAVERGPT